MIERVHRPICGSLLPSYMVYAANYDTLLRFHIDSGAISLFYITLLITPRKLFSTVNILSLNKQKGVESIEKNRGSAKNRNIFMDTYIMKKDLFVELIHKAKKMSSMITLPQIVNASCSELDIRGVAHRGYFASITDFKSYFDANMSLIDLKNSLNLFNPEWPILHQDKRFLPHTVF